MLLIFCCSNVFTALSINFIEHLKCSLTCNSKFYCKCNFINFREHFTNVVSFKGNSIFYCKYNVFYPFQRTFLALKFHSTFLSHVSSLFRPSSPWVDQIKRFSWGQVSSYVLPYNFIKLSVDLKKVLLSQKIASVKPSYCNITYNYQLHQSCSFTHRSM